MCEQVCGGWLSYIINLVPRKFDLQNHVFVRRYILFSFYYRGDWSSYTNNGISNISRITEAEDYTRSTQITGHLHISDYLAAASLF